MPPLPRIRVPMLAELARELRFAPRATLLRAADRAEALAPALTSGATVPAEWVVFKITGYRPERWPDDPGLAASDGGAVRGGLSSLVEFLTHQAAWTIAEATAGGAVTRPELAKAWNVSEKTIDRLRAEGLVARRALREDGRPVLTFMPGPVAWGKREFAARLAEPAQPTRMTPQQRARLVALAERCARRFGWSLNQTAKALAPRVGRSLEAVRQVLRAEEARREGSRERGNFAGAPSLDARRSAWMHRAWRRGAEPADIAEHARCSRVAVQRAINLRRRDLVMSAGDAPGAPTPFGELEGQAAVPATFGAAGESDLAAMITSARARTVLGPQQERALLERYRELRGVAAAWAASTPKGNPQSEPLDVAETALRWAARVKVELMRPLLTLAVETAEAVLERPIETIGAQDARELLAVLIGVAADSVEHADPARTGRLAGGAALALSTAASRWVKLKPASTARTSSRASVALPAGIAVPDWTIRVANWQASVEPDPRIRSVLARLSIEHATLLRLRFGWSGERPLTQTETGARLGISRIALPRQERAAIREGIRVARGLPE